MYRHGDIVISPQQRLSTAIQSFDKENSPLPYHYAPQGSIAQGYSTLLVGLYTHCNSLSKAIGVGNCCYRAAISVLNAEFLVKIPCISSF